jgi:uncharacterized peroxidase-related enzyme
MTFIEVVPEDGASDEVAAMYDGDRDAAGVVPNFARAFSHRPDVYAAWKGLNSALKSNMDARRFEIATLAAARRVRSSYCMLAHGTRMARDLMDEETVKAIALDHRDSGGLDELDEAVIDLADKVARDAYSVGEEDIARLRRLGLSEAEIFDVVAAASLRCFFAKTLDGLGVLADAKYAELDDDFRDCLVVGRPIAAEN